jgi:hypothetical protein
MRGHADGDCSAAIDAFGEDVTNRPVKIGSSGRTFLNVCFALETSLPFLGRIPLDRETTAEVTVGGETTRPALWIQRESYRASSASTSVVVAPDTRSQPARQQKVDDQGGKSDVEVNGMKHQEMHLDGGASAQVFVYPPSLRRTTAAFSSAQRERERRMYVIRNVRLDPEWSEVERGTFSILERAVTSLIQTQEIGDLPHLPCGTARSDRFQSLLHTPDLHAQAR